MDISHTFGIIDCIRYTPHIEYKRPFLKFKFKMNTSQMNARYHIDLRDVKCRFSKRNKFQISWIRHSDLHILTVGRYTYTAGTQITEVLKLKDLSMYLHKKESFFSNLTDLKLQTVVISPYTTPPRMNGYFRYCFEFSIKF